MRKGLIAITDGDAGLPEWGNPCVIVTLNAAGSWDELMPPINVTSLEKAFADLNAMARIYGTGKLWRWGNGGRAVSKNPAAVALGRLGGSVKSQAKTEAAKRNILKRWANAKGRPRGKKKEAQ